MKRVKELFLNCLQKEIIVGAFAESRVWSFGQARPLLLVFSSTLQRWRLKLLRPEKRVRNSVRIKRILL